MRKNEVNSFKKMLWMSVIVPMLLSITLFAADAVRIMPLGDSITHENYRDDKYNLVTSPDYIPEAMRTAYRDDLWYALQGNGYDVDFVGALKTGEDIEPPFDVDHEGHNGLEKSQMAANVKGYLEAARDAGNPADIVLLHIGTNGIRSEVSADDIDLTLDNIQSYEDTNTPVKVILARIINCDPTWPSSTGNNICDDVTPQGTVSDSLTMFNDNVVAMANARIANGDDIVIVDMESALDYNTDMIDDLHPNDAGYAKMANVWYTALEANLMTNQEHHWNFDEDKGYAVLALGKTT